MSLKSTLTNTEISDAYRNLHADSPNKLGHEKIARRIYNTSESISDLVARIGIDQLPFGTSTRKSILKILQNS